MKIRLFYTSLFAVLCSLGLYGQANFVQGKVVLSNGDTISGSINDQRWRSNPTFVEFRKNSGEALTLTPATTSEFRLAGNQVFKSYEVRYDSTSKMIDHLPTQFNPAYKQERVFLKLHVKGEASLWSLEIKGRLHFFLETANDIDELIDHHYYVMRNSQRVVLKNKSYVEQLRRFCKDCPGVEVGNNFQYDVKSISKVIIEYNKAHNSESVVMKNDQKARFNLGLVFLTAYDKFRPDFKGGVGFGAGLSSVVKFPNKNYKNSVYTELAFRKMGSQSANTKEGIDTYVEYIAIQSLEFSVIARTRCFNSTPGIFAGIGTSIFGGLSDDYSRDGVSLGHTARVNNSLILDLGIEADESFAFETRFKFSGSPTFKDLPFEYSTARSIMSVELVARISLN